MLTFLKYTLALLISRKQCLVSGKKSHSHQLWLLHRHIYTGYSGCPESGRTSGNERKTMEKETQLPAALGKLEVEMLGTRRVIQILYQYIAF